MFLVPVHRGSGEFKDKKKSLLGAKKEIHEVKQFSDMCLRDEK